MPVFTRQAFASLVVTPLLCLAPLPFVAITFFGNDTNEVVHGVTPLCNGVRCAVFNGVDVAIYGTSERACNLPVNAYHRRVLFGVSEMAGQPAMYAKACAGLADCSPFTVVLSVSREPNCNEHNGLRYGFSSDFIVVLRGSQRDAAIRESILWIIRHFDAIHLFGNSFARRMRYSPDFSDVPILRAAGLDVYFHYQGTEARLHSTFRELVPWSWVDEGDERFFLNFDEEQLYANQLLINTYSSQAGTLDLELLGYSTRSLPIFPRLINARELLEKYQQPPAATLSIVHVPSARLFKGTNEIVAVVSELKEEGFHFVFNLVEHVDHDTALSAIASASIVVDNIRMGHYAVVALEAMAMGKPVVCYMRPDVAELTDAPVVNANPYTLKSVLRKLLQDEKAREYFGKAGLEYVVRKHDIDVGTQVLAKLYEDTASFSPGTRSRRFRAAELLGRYPLTGWFAWATQTLSKAASPEAVHDMSSFARLADDLHANKILRSSAPLPVQHRWCAEGRQPKRVLLVGRDLYINVVGGPSLYAQAIVTALLSLGLHVHVLVARHIVTGPPVPREGFWTTCICEIHNPWDPTSSPGLGLEASLPLSSGVLTMRDTRTYAEYLHQHHHFDIIITRGVGDDFWGGNFSQASIWSVLTTNSVTDPSRRGIVEHQGVAIHMSPLVWRLTQTSQLFRKDMCLPPSVVSLYTLTTKVRSGSECVFCAFGSITKQSRLDLLIEAFELARKYDPVFASNARLLVIGNEVGATPTSTGPNVIVSPPVSHTNAISYYVRNCTFGVRLHNGQETAKAGLIMSTKVLEMSASALPVLVDDLPIHRFLFGSDYKLLLSTSLTNRSLASHLVAAFRLDDKVYEHTSRRVLHTASKYTSRTLEDRISSWMYRSCSADTVKKGYVYKGTLLQSILELADHQLGMRSWFSPIER